MNGPTLQDQAADALARIDRYRGALRPDAERHARWHRAVASLASAAADFAVLAAESSDDFLAAGAIGDSIISACASDALHAVVEAQREIGPLDLRQEWEDYGEALASGDSDGEEGQRLLIAIAEKLEARFGF